MLETRNLNLNLTIAVFFVATGAVASQGLPVIVSPGSVASVTAAAACPTFSWAGVQGAESHELVVYELGEEVLVAPDDTEPVLRASVPGTASSWTPAADRCLQAETRYVWFVRANGPGDAVGDWAEGAMFRTLGSVEALGAPDTKETRDLPVELQRAIDQVVERYFASAPGQASAVARPAMTRPILPGGEIPRPRFGEPAPVIDVVLEASSAMMVGGQAVSGLKGVSDSLDDQASGVVGFSTATEGFTRGVAGFSRSPDGSGLYGENSAVGGGVGIIGADFPETSYDASAGVAGITNNPNGFGGWFWNFSEGDALVVADIDPLEVVFAVDVEGNVKLDGVVQLRPTDYPPSCNAAREGAIHYDKSEHGLSVCTLKHGQYQWNLVETGHS